ncbi:MAG: ATPase [Ignisphaera sp.]|uniref:ATPase n=1 Tax=Ignisphaera aggregans TaxID=334771 RepID=A0A7J3MXD0_9CREN
MSISLGESLAYAGPAIAELMAIMGSTVGIYKVASTGLAVISEDPRLFSRVIPLALLPATQAMVYGFVFMFLSYNTLNMKVVSGGSIEVFRGTGFLTLCLFVGFAEFWSGLKQGQVCADGTAMLVKTGGKIFAPTFILATFEELFGVLGLVFGLLMSGLILG